MLWNSGIVFGGRGKPEKEPFSGFVLSYPGDDVCTVDWVHSSFQFPRAAWNRGRRQKFVASPSRLA